MDFHESMEGKMTQPVVFDMTPIMRNAQLWELRFAIETSRAIMTSGF